LDSHLNLIFDLYHHCSTTLARCGVKQHYFEVILIVVDYLGSDMYQLMGTSKKRISLYLGDGLKEELERLAQTRYRSLSNLIEVMCKKEIEQAIESGELTGGFDD
jgi:CopG-like RHH_1 or ribbon-helix-helix domain, RHH_5